MGVVCFVEEAEERRTKMSAVQVMAQSGAGGAADRTPFYGIKVPQELRKTVQLAKNMDTTLFKKIVQCEFIT